MRFLGVVCLAAVTLPAQLSAQSLRLSGYASDDRGGCTIELQVTNSTGIHLDIISATAEVTRGGKEEVTRIFFQEVEPGRSRKTNIYLSGPCQSPLRMRIMRVMNCTAGNRSFDNCGDEMQGSLFYQGDTTTILGTRR